MTQQSSFVATGSVMSVWLSGFLAMLGMAMLADPSLWSRVKYFNYNLMDCYYILGRHLQLTDDESH